MMPCRPQPRNSPHGNYFARAPRFAPPLLGCGCRSLSGYRLESRGKFTDERPFVTLRSVFPRGKRGAGRDAIYAGASPSCNQEKPARLPATSPGAAGVRYAFG